MKKIMIAIALVIASGAIVTGQGITGSAHDFSGQSWATGILCGVCHTPHNADATVSNAPLWNHEVTSVGSYTLYSSPTLDATVNQPGSSSKLCLSCHDGTVALENFGGVTGGTHFVTGNDLIGTDLSTEHPISFIYNTALATADGGLYDPATTNSGLGSTIGADLLFNGSLECASCHDVHNTAGNPKLLRIENTQSALCLTCHDK